MAIDLKRSEALATVLDLDQQAALQVEGMLEPQFGRERVARIGVELPTETTRPTTPRSARG